MSVLEISRVGACAVLTLNRPAARNALDMDLRNALAKALPEIRDDATVRAVVLTGAGGHFCAGGDIRAIAAGQGNADVFEGRNRILSMQRWFDGLVDLEKPVIAAVDGVAFGAGLSLALAADFVLASPRATFCAVFARLGYVPDLGGMYLLPRAVGLARAKALAFSARWWARPRRWRWVSRTSWSTTGRCSMPPSSWPGASSRRRRARWASSSR